MKTWDSDSARNSFAAIADAAERYANELSRRIKSDPKNQSDYVRELHDEHLAKWYVYDWLAHSSCLESREQLKAEVRSKLDSVFVFQHYGVFNKDNFQKHWRQYMESVLKTYSEAQ